MGNAGEGVTTKPRRPTTNLTSPNIAPKDPYRPETTRGLRRELPADLGREPPVRRQASATPSG
jgi:hypothetical protein